jgi:hypothetical protein
MFNASLERSRRSSSVRRGSAKPLLLGRWIPHEAEDRLAGSNPLELGEGCAPIHGDARPPPRCDREITAQDGCAGGRLDLFEDERLVASVEDDAPAPGSADVGHPVGPLTQKRDEVAFPGEVGNGDRERSGRPLRRPTT